MSKEGATINEIKDMGEVAKNDLPIDSITVKGVVVANTTKIPWMYSMQRQSRS